MFATAPSVAIDPISGIAIDNGQIEYLLKNLHFGAHMTDHRTKLNTQGFQNLLRGALTTYLFDMKS